MTREEREEAIRCLGVHSSTNGSGLCTDEQHYKAKQMAIQALSQEPCDDAVSRQAAIDAFERFIHELGIEDEPYNYGEMALSAKNVPPVTPQQSYEDIAKAFQIGLAFGFGEKHDEMNKVIEEVKKVCSPQQKSGKWITTRTFMHDGEYYCNRCKCEAPNNEKWNYCPNCGADMRGDENANND